MSPCFRDRFSLMLLEHKDIIMEFCSLSRRKEMSKETSSKILPCGDRSCWKTYKPIASLIAKGKLKYTQARPFPICIVKEVILNGDSPLPTRTVDGVKTVVHPTTVEQKLARKNELKARGTMLMALPNEHQLKINTYKDAKTLMEAIEKSSEGLDQIYDRLQKLISQLEIHGETISQENIYEAEVKGSSSTCQNTQNIAFVSTNSTGSTNEALITAHGVFDANSKANASTLSNVNSLSDAVIYSFFARKRLEVTDGNVDNESKEISQEDRKESRAPRNQDSRNREPTKRTVSVEETTSEALVSQYDGLGYDWSD
ncbi:hypothetical protein Tco_1209798 [Tanacetum coccineum]